MKEKEDHIPSAPEEVLSQLVERGVVNPEQLASLERGMGARRGLKALVEELERDAGRGEN